MAEKEAPEGESEGGQAGGVKEWRLVGPGKFELKSDNTFYFCEDADNKVKLSGQQQTYKGNSTHSSAAPSRARSALGGDRSNIKSPARD